MLQVRDLQPRGLKPVGFDLADGETLSVTGPSGSGKSLLLRAIADLDPNAGEVWLDGVERRSIPAPRWRRQVCYLSSEPGWWAERVGEHVADWDAIADDLAGLGLPPESRDWTVAVLSTGERQRLALLRALAVRPRVLLLDEPTGALDTEATRAVEELIARRREEGVAAVWVTHDAAQAGRVAARRLTVGQVPRQPYAERDLAIVAPHDVPYARLRTLVTRAAGERLVDAFPFDVYEGAPLAEDRRSVAIRLRFRHPSRALRDEEVDAWLDAVIEAVREAGYDIRS